MDTSSVAKLEVANPRLCTSSLRRVRCRDATNLRFARGKTIQSMCVKVHGDQLEYALLQHTDPNQGSVFGILRRIGVALSKSASASFGIIHLRAWGNAPTVVPMQFGSMMHSFATLVRLSALPHQTGRLAFAAQHARAQPRTGQHRPVKGTSPYHIASASMQWAGSTRPCEVGCCHRSRFLLLKMTTPKRSTVANGLRRSYTCTLVLN